MATHATRLVRVHPRDAIERYAKFEGLPGDHHRSLSSRPLRSGDGMTVT
jgi:hypothetical protein